MKALFEKIMGTYSDRELKKIKPILDSVLKLESATAEYPDSRFPEKTKEFKERYANGESLDSLLPEAFALVREASFRVLGMKHFPVQILGGIVLHQGRIAEMKTGEGKTLTATLPAYLNALTGDGVHIVTTNDYLAKRDSEWMGKIYTFLGLTVGLVTPAHIAGNKKLAYDADITYGTNNEMGFDYLRDNMVIKKDEQVQRGRNYVIIDEVDSILIDEARTPLIISGAGDKSTRNYELAERFVKKLKKHVVKQTNEKEHDEHIDADYIVDEKAKTATLTSRGVEKAEAAFSIENLSDPDNMVISHHINQALKAHGTMKIDRDYVVKEGQVLIVDEFTGRIMIGRRYSDGLHQAIEAKEGVHIQNENKTLASITFQNYFRLYKKIAGMTGTAQTEETEFQNIYNLDVIVVPTNAPLVRIDHPDSVYKSTEGKVKAILEQIKECHEKGQPVLVGTISIEKSEEISLRLKKMKIKHEVLNAKFHEKEAEIIAQAGKLGSVTIATNMAGRGTDIILGGNPEFMAKREMRRKGISEELIMLSTSFAESDDEEIRNAKAMFRELYEKYKSETDKEHEKVVAAGGLYIIGSERHESRRIDNQLRGRSGRQGDIGESQFFISLEDDLMRLFGSERVMNVYEKLGVPDDMPLQTKMLSSVLENAQKKVESRNFDARKHVLQYDDVMNAQRGIIYSERQKVIEGDSFRDVIERYIDHVAESLVQRTSGDENQSDSWQWETFREQAKFIFGIDFPPEDSKKNTKREELKSFVVEAALKLYKKKEAEFGGDSMRELERIVILNVVDQKWMNHIDEMHQLRQGIGLRAYAQRDPIVEYKFEGMDMFESMVDAIKEDVIRYIFHAQISSGRAIAEAHNPLDNIAAVHADGSEKKKNATVKNGDKVGRNELCPCGSGKKRKKCCGA